MKASAARVETSHAQSDARPAKAARNRPRFAEATASIGRAGFKPAPRWPVARYSR
jgi:hypothetical protein